MCVAPDDSLSGSRSVEARSFIDAAVPFRRDADDDRFDVERLQISARLIEERHEPPRHVPEPDEQKRNLHGIAVIADWA
jgi:hypothetical protein